MSSFSCAPHVKVMLHVTISNDDFLHSAALHCWNNVATVWINVATLCCDKIVPYNVTLRGLDFGIWKILLVESEILFGIRNTVQGIRNPTNDWNPESQFHWRRIRDPWSGSQNPGLSWISSGAKNYLTQDFLIFSEFCCSDFQNSALLLFVSWLESETDIGLVSLYISLN